MMNYPNRVGSIVALKHDEAEVARHLLHSEGLEGGVPAGSFHAALIEAFRLADVRNRQVLMRAFPEYARPIAVLTTAGGEALQKLLMYPSEGLGVAVDYDGSRRVKEMAAEIEAAWQAEQAAREQGEGTTRMDDLTARYEETAMDHGGEVAEAYLDLYQRAVALGVLR